MEHNGRASDVRINESAGTFVDSGVHGCQRGRCCPRTERARAWPVVPALRAAKTGARRFCGRQAGEEETSGTLPYLDTQTMLRSIRPRLRNLGLVILIYAFSIVYMRAGGLCSLPCFSTTQS
jgi:hypothetical protein